MKNTRLKKIMSLVNFDIKEFELINTEDYLSLLGGKRLSQSESHPKCPNLETCLGYNNCGANEL